MIIKAKKDDVVQIINGKNKGVFVHVKESLNNEIKGYVYIPDRPRIAIFLSHKDYEIIGHSYLKL